MSALKFTYRSAGKVSDGRPDRSSSTNDRKAIFVNGKRLTPNIDAKTKAALDKWSLSKGFGIVSLYSETKAGKTAYWARTEPVAIETPRMAA